MIERVAIIGLGLLGGSIGLAVAERLPDVVTTGFDADPVVREAARRAGGDPALCLLVGDSDTDRKTAKAAGVPCALVTFGPSGDDMAALEPEALLASYADLTDTVSRLIG